MLTALDRLLMIRGGAGTGKTTLIKQAVKEIQSAGRRTYLFAPTAESSKDVLRREGFETADTVARLLKDIKLQERLKDQVIWVDEAGMLGTQDTLDLLKLAEEQNARLVLSGDPKQHSAVNRGDVMRILSQVAQIPYQNVSVIYRQPSSQYRQAVELISKGNLRGGFNQLDSMGAIQECDPVDTVERLSEDYLKARYEKKSALVISPTREQVKEVTKATRDRLKEDGQLGKRERKFIVLENLYFTKAQKHDSRLYERGLVVQTYQNMRGLRRGEQVKVSQTQNGQVFVRNNKNEEIELDLGRADCFDLYREKTIHLSKGDLIRITRNGSDKKGKRFDNGKLLVVSKIERDGAIIATNAHDRAGMGVELGNGFNNFDYGYCLTSYASQGKTVDQVFIAQPAATFPASNAKQFYVSVSRGREQVTIYTDQREELIEAIQRDGDRMSVHELESRNMSPMRGYIPQQDKQPEPPQRDYDEPEI